MGETIREKLVTLQIVPCFGNEGIIGILLPGIRKVAVNSEGRTKERQHAEYDQRDSEDRTGPTLGFCRGSRI
jgi:hypothetical protein